MVRLCLRRAMAQVTVFLLCCAANEFSIDEWRRIN